MLNQQTMSILHSLKLFGMARSLGDRLADTKQASLSHAEFVGLLVQDERTHRDNLRLRRLLRKAKLRQEASLEDIDCRTARGLSQQVIPIVRWMATLQHLAEYPIGVVTAFVGGLGVFAIHPCEDDDLALRVISKK